MKMSILRRKIDTAAGRRGLIAAPPGAMTLQGVLSPLFQGLLDEPITKVDVVMSRMRIETYRARYQNWTHFRILENSSSILVAMPSGLVLAAADAALGRRVEARAGDAISSLDRRLAAGFAAKLASSCLEGLFDLARPSDRAAEVIALAPCAEDLAFDAAHAQLISAALAVQRRRADTILATIAVPVGDAAPDGQGPQGASGRSLPDQLTDTIELKCRAVIARTRMQAETLLALRPDEIIPLPSATLDRIALEADNDVAVACGRLGEFQGRRAIRIDLQS